MSQQKLSKRNRNIKVSPSVLFLIGPFYVFDALCPVVVYLRILPKVPRDAIGFQDAIKSDSEMQSGV